MSVGQRHVVLAEPAGPSALAAALKDAGWQVTALDAADVDGAADDPGGLSGWMDGGRDASIVIAFPALPSGRVGAVAWEAEVFRPLQRCFTVVRGLVPRLLERGDGAVVFAVPVSGLFTDPGRVAESVLGRSVIGLAEGLRAELLGAGVSASILLVCDGEADLASRTSELLRRRNLYSLPRAVTRSDVATVFGPWFEALADTPSDSELPSAGPMGEMYRAELAALGVVGAVVPTVAPESEGRQAPAMASSVLRAGKTAIVTGGASGIGFGIAKALLERGMNVAIADVREDRLGEAIARLGAHGERVMTSRLDVMDRAQWRDAAAAVLQRFGAIDVACLNAGVGVLGPVLQSSADDWQWVMGVNLGGVTNGLDALFPIIRAQSEGGAVLATSSAGGLMVASDGGIYSSAKFGVTALMECVRAELAGDGVSVTTLCPAAVNTNIHEHESIRPERFGLSGVRGSDVDVASRQAQARAVLAHGADPIRVGRLVADAVDARADVVFTDSGITPVLEFRAQAIMASIVTK